MTAGITTQPQLPLQAVEMGSSPPDLALSGEGITSPPTMPMKRNPDDEVQFVSSHPVKKARLRTEEGETHQRLAQVQAKSPMHYTASVTANLSGTQMCQVSAVRNDRTSLNKHVGSEPHGLAAHLLSHAMWENRGTSFPSMENFSFQTAYPSSNRPADSAAVSPKHLPQDSTIEQKKTQFPQVTQATAYLGVTMDQVTTNLDAPTYQSSVVRPGYTTTTANEASQNSVGTGGASTDRLTIPNLIAPAGIASEMCTPSSARHEQARPTPQPVSYYAYMNHLPCSPIPPPDNPAGLKVAHSQVSTQSPGVYQSHQPGFQKGQATTTALPNPELVARTQHVFNQQLMPGFSGMTATVFNPNTPGNTHSAPAKRGPCPGCIAARQMACRGQALGLHHGHLGVQGHAPCFNQQLQPSIGGSFLQQPHQLNTGLIPSTTINGCTPCPSSAHHLQPGLNWQAQSSVLSAKTLTAAQSRRSTAGGSTNVGVNDMNKPECLTQPLGVLQSLQPSTHQLPNYPSNSSSTPKIPRTPLPLSSDQNPSPTQPNQPSLPLPHPQPLSIPAATSHAASHILNRPKNQHSQNLLVDVAETATEIFPYELVARRHGCAAFKVVEALAAVVQVPLLRCATDKRRAGKLGAERVKEVREMRKVWAVRERERERLRKEQEKRGEISGAGEKVGEGSGGMKSGQGRVGDREKSKEPRSVVVPPAPGQPSVLEVAQMLGPMEMPDVLAGNGVFTVQWQ